jgi:Zn-dependent protease
MTITGDMMAIIYKIMVWAPGILFAITLHEWAHGFAADRFGDPTPRRMGRLTLNPIAHIDWVWTVLIPGLMLLFTPMVFGGAKPVPVTPSLMRGSVRVSMFWVAFAGPLANMVLAAMSALLLRLVPPLLPNDYDIQMFVIRMCLASIQMNVFLAIFNLFPVPPLDGGRIAVALLPEPVRTWWSRLERFGLPLVLILAFTGTLWLVLRPLEQLLMEQFVTLSGTEWRGIPGRPGPQ